MEQIRSILEKIKQITANTTAISTIEKDLMLRYTRDLYEAILAVDTMKIVPAQQELTEEPEPLPEEIMEEEAQAPAMEVATTTEDKEEEEYDAAAGLPVQAAAEEQLPFEQEETLLIHDEPDQSGLYTDIAYTEEKREEESLSPETSFELEPELREEKPAPFQAKSSTDFRVWNKDIRSYIGINDKYNFISELFSQNSEAYEEILNEINQCDSKQDALRFLENAGITTLYHWKEEGFSEQIFYNVLSQFFAAR